METRRGGWQIQNPVNRVNRVKNISPVSGLFALRVLRVLRGESFLGVKFLRNLWILS
jgi:hypothetical protein